MEPHTRLSIGIGSVSKLQVSLHPSDKTSVARRFGVFDLEVLHAVVHIVARDVEGPVLDLDTLGAIVAIEFGLELRDRRIFESLHDHISKNSQSKG